MVKPVVQEWPERRRRISMGTGCTSGDKVVHAPSPVDISQTPITDYRILPLQTWVITLERYTGPADGPIHVSSSGSTCLFPSTSRMARLCLTKGRRQKAPFPLLPQPQVTEWQCQTPARFGRLEPRQYYCLDGEQWRLEASCRVELERRMHSSFGFRTVGRATNWIGLAKISPTARPCLQPCREVVFCSEGVCANAGAMDGGRPGESRYAFLANLTFRCTLDPSALCSGRPSNQTRGGVGLPKTVLDPPNPPPPHPPPPPPAPPPPPPPAGPGSPKTVLDPLGTRK